MTKAQMRKRLQEAANKIDNVATMFKGSAGNYSTLSHRDRSELLKVAVTARKISEKLK